ncbi:MAG TPA: sodium-independent anion transporter [Actinobacteria bacterium]|nr:sodium-independent anion transporter [Actinomycetota bacterium]
MDKPRSRHWWLPAVPGLATVRSYRRSWLRGDLVAGVTVAAYLVPQVMAYAEVAGLPPVTGLWAALAPLLLYALLGSSRSLSMGPEATTSLMTATAIGPLAAGDPARYALLATALAFGVGLFALLAWVARLGFVADLLSRPVLVGYLAGVAVIMISGQLGRLTGVPVTGQTFTSELVSFFRGLGQMQLATVLLSVFVLAFLFVMRARWPRLPGPLIAVLLAAAVVWIGGLKNHGVDVVGAVPSGLPTPGLPHLSGLDLGRLVLPALTVLAVGFTDDVLTARSFARRDEQIDANQELLALSASNIGAGLLRGFPVSSSASRTAIGVSTGSRTQVYSLATMVTVLAVLLLGGRVLATFPEAALGAIVVYAATHLVDMPAFRRLAAFRRSEFLIALATCAGVLAFNILYGVLVAIGLSVAELLFRVGRPHAAILGQVPDVAGMHDIEDYPGTITIPGLVVFRYDAPLFFANADDFRRRALAAVSLSERRDGPVRWFLLNAEANVEADYTAMEALASLHSELTRRGIVFALARAKAELLDQFRAFGIAEKIGEEWIFPTLPTAVKAYREWAERHG